MATPETHTCEHQNGYSKAKQGAWVGILANIGLSAAKYWAGIVGHSSALVADATHSLSDTISSIIVLVGLRIASAPPDHEHPYGHGKAESIAARTVAILLIFVAVGIVWKQVESFLAQKPYEAPANIALWVALASIFVKELLYQYKFRLGNRLGSSSLVADAWHHRSDALSSIVALIGIAGAIVGGAKWHVLDHIAAIIVALIIVQVGIKIFRQTSGELMDGLVADGVLSQIADVARSVPDVKDVEKVYARKSGLGLYVDIHVEVDREMTVERSHEVSRDVGQKIASQLPQVQGTLVHIEPYYPNDH